MCAEAFQSDAAGLIESIWERGHGRARALGLPGRDCPQGALPRTSSGKPQRRKTKQMFLDGAFAKPATCAAPISQRRRGRPSGRSEQVHTAVHTYRAIRIKGSGKPGGKSRKG